MPVTFGLRRPPAAAEEDRWRPPPTKAGHEDGLDVFSLALGPEEFDWIRDFLHERTGILLRDGKQGSSDASVGGLRGR